MALASSARLKPFVRKVQTLSADFAAVRKVFSKILAGYVYYPYFCIQSSQPKTNDNMKRIAWVATMMLLCIVNVCAEQSAVPSSAASKKSLNGSWKAGKELQAMIDEVIDDKDVQLEVILAFEGKNSLTIQMPIKANTEGLSMTVDVRVPGTYSQKGEKVNAKFDLTNTQMEVTDFESDDPDIMALTKTDEGKKAFLTLINSMMKEQLSDKADSLADLAHAFENFTIKSQTDSQLTLAMSGDDEEEGAEVTFDRMQQK